MKLYKTGAVKERFFAVLFLSVIAIILRTITVLLFYDSDAGLLQNSTVVNVLNGIFYATLVLITAVCYILASDIAPVTSRFKLNMSPTAGYVLLLVAVLFLIQGIMGFLTHIFPVLKGDPTGQIPLFVRLFPLFIDVITILGAVSFYIASMEHFKDSNEKSPVYSFIMPILWCTFVLLHLIITILEIISVQSTLEKVLLCMLGLIFLYYLASWGMGAEPRRKTVFSVFIRLTFPILGLPMTLPYAIGYIFSVRDSILTIQYLCFIGLELYGVIIAMSYVIATISRQVNFTSNTPKI